MDVEEFVSKSISQVVAGVQAAQQQARERNASVVPQGQYGNLKVDSLPDGVLISRNYGLVSTVHFDIAVTTTESTSGGAGARLSVASMLGVGAEGAAAASNSATSRIQFSVLVAFKSDEDAAAESRRIDRVSMM